jgi:exoribonuclease-2
MITLPQAVREGSLVVYRNRAGRVVGVGDKLLVELDGGELVKVRPKDVVLLHPGPLRGLDELHAPPGEVQAAWELLAGSTTTLAELAELTYGSHTPATAWAAWQLVAEGWYFRGSPAEVVACTPEEVARKEASRAAGAAEKLAWQALVQRVRAGHILPEDRRHLPDVEALALGHATRSRLVRELGRAETPENAHSLLLELGVWDETVNPHPARLGVTSSPPTQALPPLPDEARADFTRLAAFAIDDAGSETPDDALSVAGNRLWVHVADVAALVGPDSPLDLEARARGATLHLPESIVPMLPWDAAQQLGLGMSGASPTLSFGVELDRAGQIARAEIVRGWARVTRLTYEEAEARLGEEPFNTCGRLAHDYQARRRAGGAILINLPEVDVRVKDGEVTLCPRPPLNSRTLVQEAMIMAGEAVARFALERAIPLPFVTQEPAELHQPLSTDLTLSQVVLLLRSLKRSQYRTIPDPHAAMGLAAYAQVTSPLRRYLDLVAHQQLAAYLHGEPLLTAHDILARIGAVEPGLGAVRQAEHLSERHWKLVYLLRHPGWRGEGVVVEVHRSTSKVLIPELGLEVQLRLPGDVPPDSHLLLALEAVNLPRQEAYFRVEPRPPHNSHASLDDLASQPGLQASGAAGQTEPQS